MIEKVHIFFIFFLFFKKRFCQAKTFFHKLKKVSQTYHSVVGNTEHRLTDGAREERVASSGRYLWELWDWQWETDLSVLDQDDFNKLVPRGMKPLDVKTWVLVWRWVWTCGEHVDFVVKYPSRLSKPQVVETTTDHVSDQDIEVRGHRSRWSESWCRETPTDQYIIYNIKTGVVWKHQPTNTCPHQNSPSPMCCLIQ
jgi:hypothetical protein